MCMLRLISPANQEDVPRVSSPVLAGSRAVNVKAMEKGWLPTTLQELEEMWARLATFFLALGLVDFATVDVWNLHPEETSAGGFPAGQSS